MPYFVAAALGGAGLWSCRGAEEPQEADNTTAMASARTPDSRVWFLMSILLYRAGRSTVGGRQHLSRPAYHPTGPAWGCAI